MTGTSTASRTAMTRAPQETPMMSRRRRLLVIDRHCGEKTAGGCGFQLGPHAAAAGGSAGCMTMIPPMILTIYSNSLMKATTAA